MAPNAAAAATGGGSSPLISDLDITALMGDLAHSKTDDGRHGQYHAELTDEEFLGSATDDAADEMCDYMDTLEQLFRPAPGFCGLPEPRPRIAVAKSPQPRGLQRWLEDGSTSDSDDAAATVLPLPIFNPTDDAILASLQRASRHDDAGAASGGDSDAEFVCFGAGFVDDLFEHTVQSIAPAGKSSARVPRVYTAKAKAAGRIGKPSQQANKARGNGGRALKLDPAKPFYRLDQRLLEIFTDEDLRLSKPEWAVRLKAASLDAEHTARVKKLRRTILSRQYSEDNRNKTKQQQKMTSEQRSTLLAENAGLRSENEALKAELERARLQIAAMRR